MELKTHQYDLKTIKSVKEKMVDLLNEDYGYLLFLVNQSYYNIHSKENIDKRAAALSEMYSLISGIDTENEEMVQAAANEVIQHKYIKGNKVKKSVSEDLELVQS